MIALIFTAATALGIAQCPTHIETSQAVRAPAGWEAINAGSRANLSFVGFALGDEPTMEVAPFAEDEDGAYRAAEFRFGRQTVPVWMGCIYDGTNMRLARRVTNLSVCVVSIRKRDSFIETRCK